MREEYIKLVIERDDLKKEAKEIGREYYRTFGALMIEVQRLKIECIRKKKMISYCQRMTNLNQRIDGRELDYYIDSVMSEYTLELKHMQNYYRTINNREFLSNHGANKVKKLYYKLVRLIHPDMCSEEISNDELIKDYWQYIQEAYQNNDLFRLEDLELLVLGRLSELGIEVEEKEIVNLELKMDKVKKEIKEIKTTKPYTYKKLLENKEETLRKRKELKNERQNYQLYSDELDKILNEFVIERMYS